MAERSQMMIIKESAEYTKKGRERRTSNGLIFVRHSITIRNSSAESTWLKKKEAVEMAVRELLRIQEPD
jgi:hypothetical protein